MKPTRVEATIAGKKITLETGQVARQAGGAVIATLGETKCFAAVTAGNTRDDIDFFPLVCDYREKTEAAGKIPGGFFKREGRPTTKEILTMRLIDRSIRPMFAEGYKAEVQVMTTVMQYDGENNPDVLAMVAAFTAIRLAGMPFETTLGAVRMAHVDGKLVAFPSDAERRGDDCRLDLVVSGHENGLCMVESSAQELTESEMIDALTEAHEVILKIVDLSNELIERCAKPMIEVAAPEVDQELRAKVFRYEDDLASAMQGIAGKHERGASANEVRARMIEELTAGASEEELPGLTKGIKGFFGDLKKKVERSAIMSGTRIDGRKWDDIREITIVPGFNPRQHGSVLFTRGETQALVSATLGTPDDEQIIDGVEEEYKKAFYLHYNFPAYSVGETRRIMGPGRREIGHGMLAERSLNAVMPAKEGFPYTVRVVSDITESNGSSSMASVCGGCLSMMLAGVPLSQPVAGIAMGLVDEDGEQAVLSDILGSEDHCGDMDFKVAGSGVGITALQMDIKVKGVTRELLERALEQARLGRIHILRKMLEAVPAPSEEVSRYAPRMETIKIPSDRIGFLIGPGGKNIRAMQADYEVRISIVDDEGNVQIYGTDAEKVKKCRDAISATMETPEVGSRYTGTVRNVRDFGAFIEILPGVEALCHISELGEGFIENVTDVVNVGDELEVEIIAVDDRGKIKVSHKATIEGAGGDGDAKESGGDDRPRRGRGRGRGRDDEREERPRARRERSDGDEEGSDRGGRDEESSERPDRDREEGEDRDGEERPRRRRRRRPSRSRD